MSDMMKGEGFLGEPWIEVGIPDDVDKWPGLATLWSLKELAVS